MFYILFRSNVADEFFTGLFPGHTMKMAEPFRPLSAERQHCLHSLLVQVREKLLTACLRKTWFWHSKSWLKVLLFLSILYLSAENYVTTSVQGSDFGRQHHAVVKESVGVERSRQSFVHLLAKLQASHFNRTSGLSVRHRDEYMFSNTILDVEHGTK